MKPWDEIVAAQIPGEVEYAEAQRVKLREKYARLQEQIDAAQTLDQLKYITVENFINVEKRVAEEQKKRERLVV